MIIPLPKYYEPEIELTQNQANAKQIKEYLNCQNWKCSVCGSVMFGRMTYCVYCRRKNGNNSNV